MKLYSSVFMVFTLVNKFHSAFRCRVHSEAKLETVTRPKEDTGTPMPWKIKMLYDGDCPLCMREVCLIQFLLQKDIISLTLYI